ncbi:glycosyltransferase family 2 protein [Patescibacteria group bacterium]|nr:glycosyltransferase family 2 protein [Patescibacteria group bacterium]
MSEQTLEKSGEKTDMTLSIIIVHYKTPSLLRQCIRSIRKHEPSFKYEIIVVDNNSMDETAQMIEEDFPSITMIANKENLGFPKAVNQGIRVSKGRYVLLLNPDITALPGVLENMITYMTKHPDIGMLGPKLQNPNGSLQLSCFDSYPNVRLIIYRRTFLGNFKRPQKQIRKFTLADWDHGSKREVAWILGSTMLARREAIDDVGLMDERFFMYMEDVDWCRRFWNKGWKVLYYPDFHMIHYYARASASSPNVFFAFFNKQTRIHIVSAIKFILKYAKQNESKDKQTKT